MPRKLSGLSEFETLKKRYGVTPQNFDQYFSRQGKDIYYNPADRVAALEDEIAPAQAAYNTDRAALEEKSLARLDLPSLFQRAAKEANPNFGLSRAELLAKFDAPEFSDTKSSSYVDPFTRTAIANRQAGGYQSVLQDATGRADAILGKDIASGQFALDKSSGQLSGLQQALAGELKQREDLAKEERQFQRALALKRVPGGGDPKPVDPLKALSALLANPIAGLTLAGVRRVPSEDGGFNFFDPEGNPISVEQASSYIPGLAPMDLLTGSRNKQDFNLTPTQETDQLEDDTFEIDLDNALSSIENGADKNEVLRRLLGAHPDRRIVIEDALESVDTPKHWYNYIGF